MKRRGQAEGFTIIETMIVLAVTSAMFVVAMAAFSGQQERTRFSQATRDAVSKVTDVANDVSAGYFADTSEWNCVLNPNATLPPTISQTAPGASAQGKNQDCIFLGKALQFGPNDTSCAANCAILRITTVVGHRLASGTNREVETLAQARPGATPVTSPYDERYNMPYKLGVYRILDHQNQSIGGIAFLTSLGAYDASNNPVAGSQTVGLYRITGTMGAGAGTFNNGVRAIRETGRIPKATLCMRMGDANGRKAAMILTEQSAGVNTDLIIDSVPAECAI